MNDINRLNFTGRLIKDIEVFQTQSEYAIVSFTVANNYSEKLNNQWVEKANFFNCKVFCKGKQFEYYNNNLKKGLLVSIDGNIKTESWEKDGQKHSKQVVNCEKIVFASENNKNQQSNTYQKRQAPQQGNQQYTQAIPDPWGDQPKAQNDRTFNSDDDIPF